MIEEKPHIRRERVGGGFGELMVVLAGIVLGQFILYAPSLIGRKVLLPLDILALPQRVPPEDTRGRQDHPA